MNKQLKTGAMLTKNEISAVSGGGFGKLFKNPTVNGKPLFPLTQSVPVIGAANQEVDGFFTGLGNRLTDAVNRTQPPAVVPSPPTIVPPPALPPTTIASPTAAIPPYDNVNNC